MIKLITLYKENVPLWGLAAVPVFGDWWYYSKLIDGKRGIILVKVLLETFLSGFVIVYSLLVTLSVLDVFGGGKAWPVWMTVTTVAGVIMAVIYLVVGFHVESALAESFGYERLFGLLWLFIPLVGPIMCLVAAGKTYSPVYDETESQFGDIQGEDITP